MAIQNYSEIGRQIIKERADRRAKMVIELYQRGLLNEEIAIDVGISKQQVRKIIRDHCGIEWGE